MSNDKTEKKSLLRMIFPSKGDSVSEIIRKIIFLVAAAALLGSLIYLGIYYGAQAHADAVNQKLREEHVTEATLVITEATTVTEAPTETAPPEETTAPETTVTEETTTTPPPPLVISDEMAGFVAKNPDTAGWITIKGTAVDNVVVQAADNDYYLKRDFYGGRSYAGTLYVDFRCVLNDYDFNQSDNIVIYGHNQKNGAMFGTLQYYKVTKNNTSRFDFYKQHPTFTFSNLYKTYTYKIIAFFITESSADESPDGKIFDVHNYVKFTKGERSFENFEKEIYSHTAVLTGVDFNKDDKYMTLSTCSNEFEGSRFIVVGRRVRDGESPDVDTSKAELNPDAKEPDLAFIYGR